MNDNVMNTFYNICPSSAKSIVMQFFCLPLSSQPRLDLLSTQQKGRAWGVPHRGRAPLLLCAEEGPLKLHILLAEDGHISDMSSTSGYMGAKYVQEFGPRFFHMSSCPKGSPLQRAGGFLLSDGSSQWGQVIIMESRVGKTSYLLFI